MIALPAELLPAVCLSKVKPGWASFPIQSLPTKGAKVRNCLEQHSEGPKVLVLAAAGRRGGTSRAREVAAEAQREGAVLVDGVQAIIHQACSDTASSHSLCIMTEHAPDLHHDSHALSDGLCPRGAQGQAEQAAKHLAAWQGLLLRHSSDPSICLSMCARYHHTETLDADCQQIVLRVPVCKTGQDP